MQIGNLFENYLTVISDAHKGLEEAVKTWLPQAEHRHSASSTVEQEFLSKMEDIRRFDPEAHAYLMKKEPASWCKAFLQPVVKCVAFENGISESFNGKIVTARGKPIITMLEDIRVPKKKRVRHPIENDYEVSKGGGSVVRGGGSNIERGGGNVGRGGGSSNKRSGGGRVGRGGGSTIKEVVGLAGKRGGGKCVEGGGQIVRNTPLCYFIDMTMMKRQLALDEEAAKEVFAEVNAAREQEMLEIERNGRVYQDWDDVQWNDDFRNDHDITTLKCPTISELEAVDEAHDEYLNNMDSIAQTAIIHLISADNVSNNEQPRIHLTPEVPDTSSQSSRVVLNPRPRSERIAKRRKLADGTADKPFTL
ncbi:hypothetical protein Tco_0323612 [Tanacetum coccineum]